MQTIQTASDQRAGGSRLEFCGTAGSDTNVHVVQVEREVVFVCCSIFHDVRHLPVHGDRSSSERTRTLSGLMSRLMVPFTKKDLLSVEHLSVPFV